MRIVKAFAGVIMILVFIAAAFIGYMKMDMERVDSQTVIRTEIPPIKDGIHHGVYAETRWANEVDVIVKDGMIVRIDLVNDVQFTKEGVFDELEAEIISGQRLDVDAVSGATITSKAYLKAIENALYP